jgi:hypothetical protein
MPGSGIEEGVQQAREGAEWARALLLHIGDSLAWLLLPREFIRGSLSVRKGGHVTFRSGFENEVKVLRALSEKGFDEIALLNDLTNCLGIGDLTVVRNGRTRTIEVKSSGMWTSADDPRIARQEIRQRWLSEYASVKEGKLPAAPHFGSSEGFRVISESEIRYHQRELSDLIGEAGRAEAGWATRKLGDEGCLTAMRRGVNIGDTDQFEILDRMRRPDDDNELFMGCVNRVPDDIRDVLPIPLFDMTYESRFGILADDVLVFVAYTKANVLRAFARKGYREGEKVSEGVSLARQDGEGQFQVLYPIRRLLYELLSLESLVKHVFAGIKGSEQQLRESKAEKDLGTGGKNV